MWQKIPITIQKVTASFALRERAVLPKVQLIQIRVKLVLVGDRALRVRPNAISAQKASRRKREAIAR